MDESEEFLKRTYKKKEYPHKIKLLTEYYKVKNLIFLIILVSLRYTKTFHVTNNSYFK